MNELIIFFLIYILTLAVLIIFAVRYKPFSDRLLEYEIYLETLNTKKVIDRSGGLISACLLVIGIPYLLNKYLGVDKLKAFELVPPFFYALMPAFCFLIARFYLDVGMSLVASFFILSHFYFAYNPNFGRVSIAWGLLSGAIWGMLSGNTIVGCIFIVLIVIGHYGTAYHTLYILGGTYLLTLEPDLFIMLVTLIVALVVWMGVFAKGAQKICLEFMKSLLRKQGRESTFFSMKSREGVIQAAFGKGFKYFTIPQLTEFLTSWTLVGVMSLGVWLFVREHSSLLALVAYSSIVLTFVVPRISVGYGIVRVWFTSLVILAPCFMVGIEGIAEFVGISSYALSLPLVILYFLCVSGILHRMRGIDKRKRLKTRIKKEWGKAIKPCPPY